MAKRKRRSGPDKTTRRTKTSEDEELYKGECVTGLPRPNQMVPLIPYDGVPRAQFPLLGIQFSDEDFPDQRQGVFFDVDYGPLWWEYVDRAPTWMDPHLFIQMCKDNPKVQAELGRIFNRNRAAEARRKLSSLLDEVMEEAYLVYMLEMFELAKPYLADWLARHHCYHETDPLAPTSQQRRRRKSPGTDAD